MTDDVPQPDRQHSQQRTIRILTAVIAVLVFALGAMAVLVFQKSDSDESAAPPPVPPTAPPQEPSPTDITVPTSVTATAAPATSSEPSPSDVVSNWPGPNTVGGAPSPEFPDALPQWTLLREWTTLPRVFDDGTWVTAPGPEYTQFPAAQNGCSTGRSLVRWRAVNPTAEIVASDLNALGAPGNEATGNSGWMDLDLCHSPGFRLVGTTDGSTLTDVTVSVRQYLPAP